MADRQPPGAAPAGYSAGVGSMAATGSWAGPPPRAGAGSAAAARMIRMSPLAVRHLTPSAMSSLGPVSSSWLVTGAGGTGQVQVDADAPVHADDHVTGRRAHLRAAPGHAGEPEITAGGNRGDVTGGVGDGHITARGAHADVVASPGQAHVPGGGADFRRTGFVQPDVTRGGLHLQMAGDPGRGDVAAGRMCIQRGQLTAAGDVGGCGAHLAVRALGQRDRHVEGAVAAEQALPGPGDLEPAVVEGDPDLVGSAFPRSG